MNKFVLLSCLVVVLTALPFCAGCIQNGRSNAYGNFPNDLGLGEGSGIGKIALSIIGSNTVLVNGTIVLEAVPVDPNGNLSFVFDWSVNPAQGLFSTTKLGKTVWTAPSATGTFDFTCAATNSSGGSGKATHQVTVVSDVPSGSPRTISGKVRDQSTDAPINGASVVIFGTGRSTITDSQGWFEFLDVPPGTYTLIATRDGYKEQRFTGIVVPAS
ncbi:MAG: carboxypeptidase regulatory-like domain-containing protein [Candidatus Riflebacteria bacterium]|nr:carboxypeptidase regulatory-like domain-containing protein [Candidatus Riflebacteria bacterium]